MSDLEVNLVIDESVLPKIYQNDKLNAFLKYWISEKTTKAVVCEKYWNDFVKEWEKSLKDCLDEVKAPFFASIRGVVTPYRDKYATGLPTTTTKDTTNEKDEKDPIQKTIDIVSRHYATVKYLITEYPERYKGKMRLGDSQILTPKQFYTEIETKNNEFTQKFLSVFEE